MAEEQPKVAAGNKCDALTSSSITAAYSMLFYEILIILVSSKILHAVLRRVLKQPKFISDFIVGMVVANAPLISSLMKSRLGDPEIVDSALTYLLPILLFVLGLEMDPRTLLRRSGPESGIAYIGMASSILFGLAAFSILNHQPGLLIANDKAQGEIAAVGLAIVLATTSSPMLTRYTTELKFGKSEIGRLAVAAGIVSDMIGMILVFLGFVVFVAVHPVKGGVSLSMAFIYVIVEVVFISMVLTPLMRWLNERCSDRQQLRPFYVLAVVALVAALVRSNSLAWGEHWMVTVFVVGLAFPREGRISTFLISNVNYMLNSIILPVYIAIACLQADIKNLVEDPSLPGENYLQRSFTKLAIIGFIAGIGKLLGTLIAARWRGIRWPEAFALGFLLNIKGHFHIFFAHLALKYEMISKNTFLVLLFVIVGSIFYIPVVVRIVSQRAKVQTQSRLMGLQWHDPSNELRMVVGLRDPQSVPAAVNIIEAVRMGSASVAVYAMDMIELTDRAAGTLAHGEEHEEVTVTEDSIVEMRGHIGAGLDRYLQESGQGLTIRRLLAISNLKDMHEDICQSAEDTMSVLLLLPFHRRQTVDGSMEDAHNGFRHVNIKVLSCSPCSVGIVVDRSLGRTSKVSTSVVSQNIVVVFIGGRDDREALSLAGMISQHPGVHLMVVRFLADSEAQTRAVLQEDMGIKPAATHEAEVRADEDFFGGFYERYIANQSVGYMEKHVVSCPEMVAMLRSLEAQYDLFIVGRGGDRNSVLTAGMTDWAECPELGPVGDILATSDFSKTASVLVVQQHDNKRVLDVIDDDFLPM